MPQMKEMSEGLLLGLSGAIPVMFFPGMLVVAWGLRTRWVLVVQMGIGLVAAVVSGYVLDTLLSYGLLAVVSCGLVLLVERGIGRSRSRLGMAAGFALGAGLTSWLGVERRDLG